MGLGEVETFAVLYDMWTQRAQGCLKRTGVSLGRALDCGKINHRTSSYCSDENVRALFDARTTVDNFRSEAAGGRVAD